jgi:prophage regulatory protein
MPPPIIGGMTSTNAQTNALTIDTILRMRAVLDERGIEKSQQYLDVQSGLYTPPIKLGAKAIGWPKSEVAALNRARISGKSNDQIRALVQQLIAARAALA